MNLSGPFLFDPRRFFGDEEVSLLSWSQVGVYIALLSYQWERGTIPTDPKRQAAAIAGGLRGLPDAEELAEIVDEFFEPCVHGAGLVNPVMEQQRDEWVAKQENRARAAAESAARRKAKAERAASKSEASAEQPPSKCSANAPEVPSDDGADANPASVSVSASVSAAAASSPPATPEDGSGPPKKLNPQAARIARIEARYAEADVKPPKPPILARWLKTLGDEARMMAFLDDMDHRGKLSVMEYCGKVVQSWEPPKRGPGSRPSLGAAGLGPLTDDYSHLPSYGYTEE